MKIERTKNTIRNISWGYAYRAVSIILPFVFRTVMIKTLGASYVGINSLFTSVLQVLNLSELGFGTAIVYNMYKPIADNDIASLNALLYYYRKIYRIIGVIVISVGLIIMPFIPHLISGDYPNDINIFYVYCMFLLNTSVSYFIFGYRSALLSAYQRNDIDSKVMLCVSLVRYIGEIIGIYITKRYYIFLWIELISTIATNLIKYCITVKKFPEIRCSGSVTQTQKKVIRENVISLLFHKIGSVVLNSGDNIVLSAFMGVVIVSNYGNYYYIMNAVQSFIIIAFAGMAAGIGNSFVVETKEKNRDYFLKVLFFNFWITCFCSSCLMCLYQDFMQVWVGKEYMFSTLIVVLIVLYFFIHTIRRTIITFRDGAGMWKDNRFQPIVSAITNIIVNILLVRNIGLAGVLISSILCMIAIDIPWESYAFCRRIELSNKHYISLLLKYLFSSIIIVLVTYLLTYSINIDPLLNFIVKGIICLLIPNFLLWIFYRTTSEYKYFVLVVKNHLRRLRKIN